MAATVMLVRDDSGGPSVYLTRRSRRSRFVPDAYVFPGGAVDPADTEPALLTLISGASDNAPPGVVAAALRELLEEAGILFVSDAPVSAPIDGDELSAMRAELQANVPFARVLATRSRSLDASPLSYYSNWITPVTEPIRFDTHFFLARAPENQIAAADAFEVHDGVWLAPREALERAARGEMTIILPTRKHLERLASFDNVDALVAHARERRIVAVEPHESSPGEFAMRLADDAW